MSIHPTGASSTVPRGTSARQFDFILKDFSLACGREQLHLCKVRNGDVLSTIWPWVREGLLFIAKKNGTRAHWLPEHIRAELARGLFTTHQVAVENGLTHQNAIELFVAHDDTGTDDRLRGFLIVYPLFDPFVTLPLTWFVWMASINMGVLDRLLPEFEEQARRRGYRNWEWKTARKSWANRAEKFGATVVEYCIAKDL